MTDAKIGKTIKESTPYWPDKAAPPEGAPNILVVLFDDVGFSDFASVEGSERTQPVPRRSVPRRNSSLRSLQVDRLSIQLMAQLKRLQDHGKFESQNV